MTCRRVQQDVAAALLTRTCLDEADAGHVDTCPACAAEQASLRQVLAVMSLASASDVQRMEPTPAGDVLLQRILRATDAERTRSRRRRAVLRAAAVAAAVVLVASGILVGAAIVTPDAHVITASASVAGVQATADIAATPSGSEVRLAVSGLPEDTDCVVVVRYADGRTQAIAAWRVEYEDVGRVVGHASASPESITNVTLTRPDGSLLLDIPVVA